MATDTIEGNYKLQSSDKFDEFLKELGVGFILRNAAKIQNPTVEVKINDGEYSLKTVTTFKTSELKFKLGEEFEEKRLDDATVKTKVTRDGNKLIQEQFGDKPCEITREFDGDTLTTVCKIKDIVSTRIYKRV
ncbi:Fatty acid-binding protein [Halotydeus destructor]|nr:Fatty acid-binding protein [Halotydeus destructor]